MVDGSTLRSASRLFELESSLQQPEFVRVSRQEVVNLDNVQTIRPEFDSRLVLGLKGGRESVVSRSYALQVKSRIGIVGQAPQMRGATMSHKDLAYGDFDGEEHEGAGRAVTRGLFVGSTWVVATILAWVVSDVVASDGLDENMCGAAGFGMPGGRRAAAALVQLPAGVALRVRGACRRVWRYVLRRAC